MSSQLDKSVIIRDLGMVPYLPTWERMQSFTLSREADTPDEIWLLEHPPVFTQGQAGKQEHILAPGDIPIVQADRGGQVTYHGPGQLVAYVLLDLSRHGSDIRQLVTAMETSIVDVLALHSIKAAARKDAPGVYVNDEKICSLGLRVKKGRTFHGLALNVDMDLSPFLKINPCGYAGLNMTQVKLHVEQIDMADIKQQWVKCFSAILNVQPVWQVG